MCGEYHTYKISKVDNRGSPPHVWRILFNRCNHTIINRITSTCVENTRADEYLLQQYWDHLHMCGEYVSALILLTRSLGSPPHVWRILFNRCNHTIINRITSTCVENTLAKLSKPSTIRDHLHMCGEYWFCRNKVIQDLGSPPHVWRIQLRSN